MTNLTKFYGNIIFIYIIFKIQNIRSNYIKTLKNKKNCFLAIYK